jgi:hypothetical protein
MKYYYLAASLPALALDQPPPFSFSGFRALCAGHLGDDDMAALDELDRPPAGPPRHPFVRAWAAAETRLRNAVARARAARLRRDPAESLREQEGADFFTEKAVADAMARPDPLEREMALDRLRWRLIEDLAGHDPFDGRAVLAYGAKLRLAGRWAALAEPAAWNFVESVVGRAPAGGGAPA